MRTRNPEARTRASRQGYLDGVRDSFAATRDACSWRDKVDDRTFPIYAHKQEFLTAVKENQVTVLVGPTGSGKTTKSGYFLYKAGYAARGVIGITQPRRVAAISVADYTAESLGVPLGTDVGYKIRFDDSTDNGTAIKFMTDGILLRELQNDPDLSAYSVIGIDEAHERSLNIDFILGLLKAALKRRPDLKAVIMSATIDPKKFADYFGGAPLISVSGSMFSVDVIYKPIDGLFAYNEEQVVDAVVEEVLAICREPYEDDDVLVFLTGKSDIDRACKDIRDALGAHESDVAIRPIYGAMMPEEQKQIFHRTPGKRKVVIATNIAETSLTIDGIAWVVDAGFVKQSGYDPLTGIGNLDVVEHSQAGCDQRKGRAGRTKPGTCIRLFSEANFKARPLFTEPEIRRTDLAGVVLQMLKMEISDIENFDFIDPPDKAAFSEAHATLRALGAIDNRDRLTDIGLIMAELPLEPRISRMLIEAQKLGAINEVAAIAASLGQHSPFRMPQDEELQEQAKEAHREFQDSNSDFETLLNLYCDYHQNGASRRWASDRFIDWRVMEEVTKIHSQIIDIVAAHGWEPSSNENREIITRAVASGLIQNLAEKDHRHSYQKIAAPGEAIFIHPSSGLFGTHDPFIIFTKLRATKRCYAHGCAVVDPVWLPEIAPHLVSVRQDGLLGWDTKQSAGLARETIILQGREIGYRKRAVSLAEAHALQGEQIRKATAAGFRKLSVRKGARPWDDFVGTDETGNKYRISRYLCREHGEYYCEVTPGFRSAMPRFSIISLPPLPKIETPKPKESKAPAAEKDALAALAQKFQEQRAR